MKYLPLENYVGKPVALILRPRCKGRKINRKEYLSHFVTILEFRGTEIYAKPLLGHNKSMHKIWLRRPFFVRDMLFELSEEDVKLLNKKGGVGEWKRIHLNAGTTSVFAEEKICEK